MRKLGKNEQRNANGGFCIRMPAYKGSSIIWGITVGSTFYLHGEVDPYIGYNAANTNKYSYGYGAK